MSGMGELLKYYMAIIATITSSLYTLASVPFLSSTVHSPLRNADFERVDIRMQSPKSVCDTAVWDFSKLKKGRASIVSYQRVNDTMALESRSHSVSRFVLSGDTLKTIQFDKPGETLTYRLPKKEFIYPMLYGDSIAFPFFAEGNCGRIAYLRNCGMSTVKADGLGMLITPENDTVCNVMRIHRVTIGGLLIDGSFTANRDNDSIEHQPAAILRMAASDSVQYRAEKWEWYAMGYTHPVIEHTEYTVKKFGVTVDSVAQSHYTPIDGMEYEEPEPEEMALAEELWELRLEKSRKSNRQMSNNGGKTELPIGKEEKKATITYNPSNGTATVAAYGGNAITGIYVANSSGQILRKADKLDDLFIEIDISHYANGVYLIVVTSANGIYSEKIIKE